MTGSIDIDETMRAKMRKLRVSTFADVFYSIVADEAYRDALPDEVLRVCFLGVCPDFHFL